MNTPLNQKLVDTSSDFGSSSDWFARSCRILFSLCYIKSATYYICESKHNISDKKQTTRFTDGVCDACRWADMKEEIDWNQRESELLALCDKYRSNDGSYDVVVPASGGKDSRYVAHILKYKYRMNPLTVTWKPHIYTDVGFSNLLSMIDNGFDNILISPNGKYRSFYVLSLSRT